MDVVVLYSFVFECEFDDGLTLKCEIASLRPCDSIGLPDEPRLSISERAVIVAYSGVSEVGI